MWSTIRARGLRCGLFPFLFSRPEINCKSLAVHNLFLGVTNGDQKRLERGSGPGFAQPERTLKVNGKRWARCGADAPRPSTAGTNSGWFCVALRGLPAFGEVMQGGECVSMQNDPFYEARENVVPWCCPILVEFRSFFFLSNAVVNVEIGNNVSLLLQSWFFFYRLWSCFLRCQVKKSVFDDWRTLGVLMLSEEPFNEGCTVNPTWTWGRMAVEGCLLPQVLHHMFPPNLAATKLPS